MHSCAERPWVGWRRERRRKPSHTRRSSGPRNPFRGKTSPSSMTSRSQQHTSFFFKLMLFKKMIEYKFGSVAVVHLVRIWLWTRRPLWGSCTGGRWPCVRESSTAWTPATWTLTTSTWAWRRRPGRILTPIYSVITWVIISARLITKIAHSTNKICIKIKTFLMKFTS